MTIAKNDAEAKLKVAEAQLGAAVVRAEATERDKVHVHVLMY